MSAPFSQRIFRLPELVELIWKYLDTSDRARLARSNSQLFYMLMPKLWVRVEGLAQLFALSPDLDNVTKSFRRTLYLTWDNQNFITSLKPLSDESFARFEIYSRWIKHLEVCQYGITPKYGKALALLYASSLKRIILPQIESISSTVQGSFSTAPLWVLPFLSPTLLSLEYTIITSVSQWSIPASDFSILLTLLPKACPRLKTFSITPRFTRVWIPMRDETSLLVQSFDLGTEEELGHYLSSSITVMQPLVSFSTSIQLLDESCFRLISTWPLLDSFEVIFELDDDPDFKFPKVSETSFPVLKHLGFYQAPSWSALRHIWNIPALVGKLHSVKLRLGSACVAEDDGESAEELAGFFCVISRHSPKTQKLWLHAKNPFGPHPAYRVSTDTLSVLKGLSLQRLHLGGVEFKDFGELLQFVRTTFPELRELGLPRHSVTWTELRSFQSELPQLEILRTELKLDSISTCPKIDLNTVSHFRSSPLHTLEVNLIGANEMERGSDISSMRYCDAKALLDYIFSLWPNVQLVPQEETQYIEDFESPNKLVTLMNDQLASLSYCNREPLVQYKSIRVLNEESWQQCG